MTKETVTKLIYQGTGQYTTGIPARDLEIEDLVTLAGERGVSMGALIATLTSRGLYVASSIFTCPDCGKPYKTWAGMNKHVIDHHLEVKPAFPSVEVEAVRKPDEGETDHG